MRKILATLALLSLAAPAIPQATRWTAPVSFTITQDTADGKNHPFQGSISLYDTTDPNNTKRLSFFPLDATGSTGVINVVLQKTDNYRIDLANNSANPVIRQSAKINGAFLLPVAHANFKITLDWTTDSVNYHGITDIQPDIEFVFPVGSFY